MVIYVESYMGHVISENMMMFGMWKNNINWQYSGWFSYEGLFVNFFTNIH